LRIKFSQSFPRRSAHRVPFGVVRYRGSAPPCQHLSAIKNELFAPPSLTRCLPCVSQWHMVTHFILSIKHALHFCAPPLQTRLAGTSCQPPSLLSYIKEQDAMPGPIRKKPYP